ncbi:MAG TPA: hypothetical protein VK662_11040, partial [Acidothermaceae bacterium]|nr:hypothetical protein [Acidothermaceae bacterium]
MAAVLGGLRSPSSLRAAGDGPARPAVAKPGGAVGVSAWGMPRRAGTGLRASIPVAIGLLLAVAACSPSSKHAASPALGTLEASSISVTPGVSVPPPGASNEP